MDFGGKTVELVSSKTTTQPHSLFLFLCLKNCMGSTFLNFGFLRSRSQFSIFKMKIRISILDFQDQDLNFAFKSAAQESCSCLIVSSEVNSNSYLVTWIFGDHWDLGLDQHHLKIFIFIGDLVWVWNC